MLENPYRAPTPEPDEAPPVELTADLTLGVAMLCGAAVFALVVRLVVPILSNVVLGIAIGWAGARAARETPNRHWPLLAAVVCVVAIGAACFLPTSTSAIRLASSSVVAMVIAAAGPMRVARAQAAVAWRNVRDDDQRARFARPLAAPPTPTRMRARIACAKCGELSYEDELARGRLCRACQG